MYNYNLPEWRSEYDTIMDYIRGFYPDWSEDRVTYRKWRGEDDGQ